MHDAILELNDDDDDVVAPEQYGVDTSEFARHDPACLRAEELGPRRTIARWCRRHSTTAKRAGDSRPRDDDTELLELTDDAQIAPSGSLVLIQPIDR